jgi:hypothetical protein
MHPAIAVHLADILMQATTVLAVIVHEKAMVEADNPFSLETMTLPARRVPYLACNPRHKTRSLTLIVGQIIRQHMFLLGQRIWLIVAAERHSRRTELGFLIMN